MRSLHRSSPYLEALPWSVLVILLGFMALSGAILVSAGKGSWYPWALPQMIRFGLGITIMIVVLRVDWQFWLDKAYIIYGLCCLLLGVVEIFGHVGMGAQRWINLGVINLQPSELMKLALILSLARYFHYTEAQDFSSLRTYIVPLTLVMAPLILVLKQPDLGTAMMLLMVSLCMIFVAGIPWVWLISGSAIVGVMLPIAWSFLRDYQKNRVLTFLDPERDPLGTGYHIIQSKIALGSGGVWGKGYTHGTQSALNFLPEKQTDFIFAMFGEEFGLVGTLLLLCAYGYLILYGWKVTTTSRSVFCKFVALGITSSLFIYVAINTGMVMGLVPVVGVPLPFLSYGGTALLTLLMGMGLLIGCDIQRHRSRGGWG